MTFQRSLFALVLAAVLLFTAPVMRPGSFQGHETPLKTIWRLAQLDLNVRSHAFPPRWAPGFCKGRGTPFFIFYPPLFLYVAELLHLAGAGFPFTLDAAVFIFALTAATGMYFFARELWSPAGAVLSAVAYMLFPYRIAQLYIRGAYAEFAAGCVLPWALWAGSRFLKTGRRRAGAATGLFIFLIFLGHNVITLMFMPMFVLWLTLVEWRKDFLRQVFRRWIWVGLGAAAASCFWAPALREMPLVSIRSMRTGYFDIGVHFAYPHQLFGSLWGYGPSQAGPDDKMPFQIGIIWIFAALIALIDHWKTEQIFIRRNVHFWFAAAVFFIFMNLSISEPIWRLIPGLAYSQFPWRTLTLLALPLSILAGGLADLSGSMRTSLSHAVALAGSLLIFAYSGLFIRAPGYADLSKADLSREMFARTWITTTASGEYIPRWVTPENRNGKAPSPQAVRILSGKGSVEHVTDKGIGMSITLDARTPLTLRITRYFYPGWSAEADGRSIPLAPDSGGYIRVKVPSGTRMLVLRFGETRFRAAVDILSMVSLLALLVVCMLPKSAEER